MTAIIRSVAVAVFLILAITMPGCYDGGSPGVPVKGNQSEVANNQNPNASDQPNEIKSESRSPIIEIWKELEGSVAIAGKSLHFRMYDDGAFEFDYQLSKADPSGKPRHTFSIQRTPPTDLSEEGFKKFKSLLEDLTKSKDIKKEYQTVALVFDVITKLTILLNENVTTERKIIINDSDLDVFNSRFEKIFPRALINLFKEIQLIRKEHTPSVE